MLSNSYKTYTLRNDDEQALVDYILHHIKNVFTFIGCDTQVNGYKVTTLISDLEPRILEMHKTGREVYVEQRTKVYKSVGLVHDVEVSFIYSEDVEVLCKSHTKIMYLFRHNSQEGLVWLCKKVEVNFG